MEIIKEPKKNIALLWNRPKKVEGICRPMKYLLSVQVDERLLLYNIVTSEMILLNKDEKTLFEKLPAVYCPEMDNFIDRHYIVADDFKEYNSVRELRAIMKKLEPSKRVTGFTILPTTECNARCYYCFESDHKRCTLTEKITEDVIDYIEEKCKGEPIDISWFGGEPLVGSKRISQICKGLTQKEISFNSSMVSNAYLFDEKLVEIAKNEWNLNSVQITLDGTEKVYNDTKAYVRPKENPFKRVLKNIDLLLDNEIAVSVRLNVTDKNKSDLDKLIDLLSVRFGGKKGFSCYSHAVYEGVGFKPLEYDDDKRKLVDSQTAYLDTKLMDIGLLGSHSFLPGLRIIHCMSDNDSCRVIYPDGKIGKCENKSSLDSVGDIYSDIINDDMDKMYKEVKQLRECENCCLCPNCISLSICPETGMCNQIKVNWKIERYKALMKAFYLKHKEVSLKSEDTGLQVIC